MSFRTVVISSICKLDLKMGYLVIRGEETKRIFLDEIEILLIENSAVSLTGCLIEELSNRKIKVIFCDSKRNPVSELVPYYGCHDCSQKIRFQIAWSEDIKGAVWTEIVSDKIRKQSALLAEHGKMEKSRLLESYLAEIEFNDASNREGHAAKVYFNALFGLKFTRGDSSNIINSALNYGYSILLSDVTREITANGYLTQMGIFHNNMFNPFNLSSDLMEPFRVFIDRYVASQSYTLFESKQKHALLELFHQTLSIDGSNQTMLNAVRIYVKSVFNALNEEDISVLKFPTYEL